MDQSRPDAQDLPVEPRPNGPHHSTVRRDSRVIAEENALVRHERRRANSLIINGLNGQNFTFALQFFAKIRAKSGNFGL